MRKKRFLDFLLLVRLNHTCCVFSTTCLTSIEYTPFAEGTLFSSGHSLHLISAVLWGVMTNLLFGNSVDITFNWKIGLRQENTGSAIILNT